MDESANPASWSAYEKLVMSTLHEQKTEIAEMHEDIVLLRIEVAKLKMKAGIWGAVAGMIPAVIPAVVLFSTAMGGS